MGFVGAWIETPRKWLRFVRVPLRRGRWLMRRRPKKTEKEVSDIYTGICGPSRKEHLKVREGSKIAESGGNGIKLLDFAFKVRQ